MLPPTAIVFHQGYVPDRDLSRQDDWWAYTVDARAGAGVGCRKGAAYDFQAESHNLADPRVRHVKSAPRHAMNYPLRLDSKLLAVPGIGPKRAQMLAARGLLSVGDLLLYLPTRYRDWRTPQPIERCEPGTVVTLAGELEGLSARPMRGAWGRRIVEGWLREEGGERMAVIWFNAPTYLCDTLKAYGQVVLQGRVRHGVQGRMELHHPEVFPRHQAPAIVPEYALGAELGQRLMRSLIARVLPAAAALPALVPAPLRADAGLLPPADAVRYLHQPPPQADLDALVEGTTAAHRTLALDELFAFDLALMMERSHARERQGVSFDRPAVLSTR